MDRDNTSFPEDKGDGTESTDIVEVYYTGNKCFDEGCAQIVQWAKNLDCDFQNVYGVPRGGLPMAVAVSNYLDIPLVSDRDSIMPGTLIVDDIAHKGETLKTLLSSIFVTRDQIKIAVIFVREETEVEPDFYCHKTDQWIRFPWEPPAKRQEKDETLC